MAQNNTVQIKHVIQTLSQEFALSQHPHSRKGGLIGLAACSIALGKVGLSPEGTDAAEVAFTLTSQTQQAAADFCFTTIRATLETSQAGFAALGPRPGPRPGRPTCLRPALTRRPEPFRGSQDVRWGGGGGLWAPGAAHLELSLLPPPCRTQGCT